MFRVTHRDMVWLVILVVASVTWGYDHSMAVFRELNSQERQAALAAAVRRQAELAEKMQQRLYEYENQHVLMRRLLRVAKQD
jgi:hypothetical protein